MIAMRLAAAQGGFFDREKVQRSMDQATLRALSKFGGRTRIRARHSIRKRKAVSVPGNQPSSHVSLLREKILYAMEGKNVVIGPMLLNGTQSERALEALEKGGESWIVRRGKKQRIMVAARPFMQPAFDTEIAKAPELWRDQMR